MEFSVPGSQEMKAQPGIGNPLTDKIGNGAGIVHQADGILEYVLVDPLKNVLRTGIGFNLQGIVDMSVSKHVAFHRIAIQFKRKDCLFHRQPPWIDLCNI